MKKILLLGLSVSIAGISFGQKLASKNAENKKVVIEEFTGKTCGWCPAGHKAADELAAKKPGQIIIINTHSGSYATGTPNYRVYVDGSTIEYGKVLYQLPRVGLTGFPSGTMNRSLLGGTKTAKSYGNYDSESDKITSEASPVNIGVIATFDPVAAKIIVYVEAYYTGNSNTATNKLSVGLLQDGIMGPQSGMSKYPALVVGSEYTHNRMHRASLTGQWGEDITTTSSGTVVARVYEWDVIEDIGGDGKANTVPQDMIVYAFVAEGQEDIMNGAEAHVTVAKGAVDVITLKKMANMVESDPTNSELATFDPKTEGGAFRVVSVEERTNFSGIKLYPNPTTGSSTLTFSSEVNDNAVVRVISVTGQEMVNFSNDVNVGDNVIQVDMTSFESGYYFVEVTGETGVITRQQVLKK